MAILTEYCGVDVFINSMENIVIIEDGLCNIPIGEKRP